MLLFSNVGYPISQNMRYYLLFFALVLSVQFGYSQDLQDLETILAEPRTSKSFELDYAISQPRLHYVQRHEDIDAYNRFLTDKVLSTQMSMSFEEDGVTKELISNAAVPMAQLDTSTLIQDPKDLYGVWRMLAHRQIQFVDSTHADADSMYTRLDPVLLADHSDNEVLIVIHDDRASLYAQEAGNDKLRKKWRTKYILENGRFLMLYKMVKSSAGVSQVGITEDDYLVLNYPTVSAWHNDEYIVVETTINQFILEKVR